jgi:hypothetical protein
LNTWLHLYSVVTICGIRKSVSQLCRLNVLVLQWTTHIASISSSISCRAWVTLLVDTLLQVTMTVADWILNRQDYCRPRQTTLMKQAIIFVKERIRGIWIIEHYSLAMKFNYVVNAPNKKWLLLPQIGTKLVNFPLSEVGQSSSSHINSTSLGNYTCLIPGDKSVSLVYPQSPLWRTYPSSDMFRCVAIPSSCHSA